MRRGFKAAAERTAEDLRKAVGCTAVETIDLSRLARHLKVAVMPADALVPREALQSLHNVQPGAFSAATFPLPDRRVIVYNPINMNGEHLPPTVALQDGRTRSNIAHEISHLVLAHAVREVRRLAGATFFTCDPDEEAEANWLAGALLVPRPALVRVARQGLSDEAVAATFQVTAQMAGFRMNATGVRMQVARTRGTAT